ncbi:hypothetical protein J6500_12705 [Bradyrhizobium sp. WSM 1704]|uniref:hypothetical protein n=1 Tax=Bradyrhizobium semiaridum TaxID=2821404 RepID=UPI001CE31655|nr:hypothetical protein [Bradyrhizobium semiaridum]MCA6122749.1 hypothetical protein [Bradyrhizobium semiaridum]
MHKSFLAIIAAAAVTVVVSSTAARSAEYVIGDAPYRLDYGHDRPIETGCLKWNWQLYQWQDLCPVYIRPKAYMYPRGGRVVLRTRG